MQSSRFDVAIIGAGIIGCAMARRMTLDGASVVVLEKASDVLDGASKGNSALLHTGFDAPPGSVEQSCIARGYAEYHDVAKSLGLPILKSGAMVLAWDEEQLSQLPSLVEKAQTNGVHDVAMLTREQIRMREPNLSDAVLGGFEVPREFIIDPWATAHAYLMQALENGAQVSRDSEVLGGQFEGDHWVLDTTKGTVEARQVINCAGLYGDILDERLIGERSFTLTPRKGQFVVYDKPASDLVSAIILPVPTKTTKGVVICRTIFGNVLVGPTAEDQDSRTDASTNRETLIALHEAGVRMIPALQNVEVTTAYAGLRPATEFSDYQIRYFRDQNYTCVGGIRSTGLSSALGVAIKIAEQFKADDFGKSAIADPVIPAIDRLSNYHPRDWEATDHGGIVCHCELVTRREIEEVLAGPLPPATLQGLKRRTRVCMGRCQGFYCTTEVARLTAGKINPPLGTET